MIQCLCRVACLSVGLRTTYATTILTNAGVGVWDGLTQQLRDLNCTKCDFPAKNCLRSHLGHVDRSALLAPDSHLTQLLLDTCFGPCSPAPLLKNNKPREPFWCLSGSCGLVFVRRDAGEKSTSYACGKASEEPHEEGGAHISNPIYWHDQPLLTTFKKWRVLRWYLVENRKKGPL